MSDAESHRRIAFALVNLDRQIATMVEYLDLRREVRDWHGVMDASCDIRELEARKAALMAIGGGG